MVTVREEEKGSGWIDSDSTVGRQRWSRRGVGRTWQGGEAHRWPKIGRSGRGRGRQREAGARFGGGRYGRRARCGEQAAMVYTDLGCTTGVAAVDPGKRVDLGWPGQRERMGRRSAWVTQAAAGMRRCGSSDGWWRDREVKEHRRHRFEVEEERRQEQQGKMGMIGAQWSGVGKDGSGDRVTMGGRAEGGGERGGARK